MTYTACSHTEQVFTTGGRRSTVGPRDFGTRGEWHKAVGAAVVTGDHDRWAGEGRGRVPIVWSRGRWCGGGLRTTVAPVSARPSAVCAPRVPDKHVLVRIAVIVPRGGCGAVLLGNTPGYPPRSRQHAGGRRAHHATAALSSVQLEQPIDSTVIGHLDFGHFGQIARQTW
ncbi:hypothetical protein ACI65C_000548 [Semiaphis heraclei]